MLKRRTLIPTCTFWKVYVYIQCYNVHRCIWLELRQSDNPDLSTPKHYYFPYQLTIIWHPNVHPRIQFQRSGCKVFCVIHTTQETALHIIYELPPTAISIVFIARTDNHHCNLLHSFGSKNVFREHLNWKLTDYL